MRRQRVLEQRPSVVGGAITHIVPDIFIDLLHSRIHTLHHTREPVLHELIHLLHEYLVHALVKNARLDLRAIRI